MSTTFINETEIDTNVYEALFMQAEIIDDVMSYAGQVYGDEAVERIFYGDTRFTARVCNEYWQSILA